MMGTLLTLMLTYLIYLTGVKVNCPPIVDRASRRGELDDRETTLMEDIHLMKNVIQVELNLARRSIDHEIQLNLVSASNRTLLIQLSMDAFDDSMSEMRMVDVNVSLSTLLLARTCHCLLLQKLMVDEYACESDDEPSMTLEAVNRNHRPDEMMMRMMLMHLLLIQMQRLTSHPR